MAIRLIPACKEGPARQATCREAISIGITVKQNNSIAISGIGIRIKADAPSQLGRLIEQHSIQTF